MCSSHANLGCIYTAICRRIVAGLGLIPAPRGLTSSASAGSTRTNQMEFLSKLQPYLQRVIELSGVNPLPQTRQEMVAQLQDLHLLQLRL
ncbi:hypothetical protein V1517DRAFT_323677 [Lipomyces orientalis]|uniref:Uncharacterized protein n=1 Tax=Lipomyces orientalis TaxID=1233043 RepID=A0ACC3TMS8_9ASCO